MIVIVRERILRCRRTDILDVGESTLDVGEQTVDEATAIPFFVPKHFQAHWNLYFESIHLHYAKLRLSIRFLVSLMLKFQRD